MNEAAIRKFAGALEEMIMESLKASPEEVAFGSPCSNLIRRATRIGVMALAKELLSSEYSREFRLNGAGLKMLISKTEGGVRARISKGDQYNHYPKTAPALERILRAHGFCE